MGAVKALPTDLLHALTGAVCFVRMITATLRNSIDGAMDWLYDFLAKLSVGTWAAVELPDCDVEAPSDPYHCLVTVSRATVLYSSIMFPLKHIQYWDASSPPLVDPCSDQVVLDSTVTFKFTAPGMMSVYALQSHTFLSLGLSCTNSPVPDKYLLAYQSKDKKADRASLLVIVDEDGTVTRRSTSVGQRRRLHRLDHRHRALPRRRSRVGARPAGGAADAGRDGDGCRPDGSRRPIGARERCGG